MPTQTVDFPSLDFRASIGSVNEEKRTIDLIFSTGATVTRTDPWSGKSFREVLSMEPAHVRTERLNTVGVLLDSHASWSIGDVLGTVEAGSVRVAGGKGLATVRFSKRANVEPVWQDVRDGIVRSVSVGYRTYKYLEDVPNDGGVPTRTAVDWEPYEVSLVGMPADAGARLRAGDKSDTNPCLIVRADATGVSADADRLRRLRFARVRAY